MARQLFSLNARTRRRHLAFAALVGAWVGAACDASPDIVAREREAASAPQPNPNTGGVGGESPIQTPAVMGGFGGSFGALPLTGDLNAHDPELFVAQDEFFVVFTGALLPTKRSEDLLHWEATGRALQQVPGWIEERLPGVTDLWAPDLAQFGGEMHLYYAASTFASGRSCIGHATSPELNDATTWRDEGFIICSDVDEVVPWDAIDPSAFVDEQGNWWMVFGSYDTGIKLIPLDADGGRLGDAFFSLAERPVEKAIQAPTAIFHDGFYYLFATFDQCCAGVNSTTNIRVGRAADVRGPYVDKDGTPLLEGGGSPFILGTDNFRGVGANSLFTWEGQTYTVYHAYDASAAGQATMRIAPVTWDDEGWPEQLEP